MTKSKEKISPVKWSALDEKLLTREMISVAGYVPWNRGLCCGHGALARHCRAQLEKPKWPLEGIRMRQ
jgi:hypothetical protein